MSQLSSVVAQRYWLAHPDQAPPDQRAFINSLAATARAQSSGKTAAIAPAGPLTADVFNRDGVGFPQNEESVTSCENNVLEGTNDYRGNLDPQSNFTGWYLSRDRGRTVRNEGLLPSVTIAGRQVPSGGDPVDASGSHCSLYAASLNYDPRLFENAPSGVGVYRSTPARLASCPQGTDIGGLTHPTCWPVRKAVATVPARHFADKEWMDVGRSGSAGQVVWVTFTDFKCNAADCFGEPITFTNQIKAVRCRADLTGCTQPILISGQQNSLQFSDVTIGPDGRTYVTWEEDNFLSSGGQPPSNMRFWLRVAQPGSTTFGPPREIAFEPRDLSPLHANDFRVATIPKNEVKIVGGKPRVFLTWDSCQAKPLDVVCEEPRINLAWSDDFGLTWRRSVLSAGGDNYFPSISENRGGGALAVAWFTNRYDPVFHNRQDVVLATVNPLTGQTTRLQRLTPVSNESEADPLLGGTFIGDYIEVFAVRGTAYVGYNANYRSVQLLGQGNPIPQQDNYLTTQPL
ncbi:MAG: hypothetical protein ABJA93_11025 [Sporichthyaceae bacterium]